ncbi:MAG: RNA-binding S4 domain-containing protein [Methyloligellaceae bacterium]
MAQPKGQRLDRWLWFARLVKTRTLAARLVSSGKVRVNRERELRPGRQVREGDVITAVAHGRVRIFKVLAAGARRGPAAEARTLYEDLTPAPAPGAKPLAAAAPAQRLRGSGRPTKRDRRRIDAFLSGMRREGQ